MVTAVLSSYQPSLMGPLGPRPAIPRTPSEETRSTSTESSGTGVEKIRLRVGCGGKFVLVSVLGRVMPLRGKTVGTWDPRIRGLLGVGCLPSLT